MSTRTVHVEYERIGRWITNFARQHGGATIVAGGTAGSNGPAVDRADSAVPHRDAHDDDAAPRGEGEVVRVRGADGEVAHLHRWPQASGAQPPTATTPGHAPALGLGAGDATTPENLEAITTWCAPPTHLGLVLIRRGGYAVGRAEGATLISHKTGTRYVQSRTAAGGWSQQRFARRRGNQADALVGAVVDLAARHLLPPPAGSAPQLPEAMVLGGDRALAEEVLAHPRLKELARLPHRMFADLPEPRFAVLETALQRGRSVPVRITPGR